MIDRLNIFALTFRHSLALRNEGLELIAVIRVLRDFDLFCIDKLFQEYWFIKPTDDWLDTLLL